MGIVLKTLDVAQLKQRDRWAERLKIQRIKSQKFLREQILQYDRIDLLMSEVLDYQVKDFHLMLWHHRKKKYLPFENQKWHLALASRGCGKSTILTIASIILDILQNPNVRILIASKTDSNAIGFLSEIKQKLCSKKLVALFGEQRGDLWNEGEIKVKPRTSTSKESTVTCVGVSGALASKHFDRIYADDLVDEENSKTEVQREKLKTWMFKILDPTLEPDGELSMIGTRYHPEDLYGQLIDEMFEKKNEGGKVTKRFYIRIPALIRKKEKDIREGCKPWEKYISIWPEKFSVKFLLKKRKSQGSIIFSCLTAKTRVLTKRGYVAAKAVVVGDFVWTGNWRKVLAVKSGEHRDVIYGIRTWYNHSWVNLTSEHRVLVNGEFIQASKVKPWDFVQFPINQKSDLLAVPEMFRNPEVFKLIGHWLANGSCYGPSGNNRWKTVISIGTHRRKQIDDMCRMVNTYLLRLNRMGDLCTNGQTSSMTVSEQGTVTNLIFTNKLWWEFVQQFGKYAHGKFLPHWVQDLPKEYILELFRGYHEGDGFVLTRNGEVGVNSVSRNMLEGFQQALLKVDIISRVQKVSDATQKYIDGSDKLRNCRTLYGLFVRNLYAPKVDPSIPVRSNRKYKDKGFIRDGIFYIKVREVIVKRYAGKTYDFEVSKDHVFTSGLVTLHNSQMLNDVEAMKGKIFKVDWFQFYKPNEINLADLLIFQGVDLAIKQKDKADKFAHVTIGIDKKTRNIYILNYYNRVTHYKMQKQLIKDRFKRYDPIRVAIEGNGYQRAIIQDMQSDAKLADVRAVPIFTEDDKTLRAWKLSAYFERGQVFMLESMHELQQILLKMPDSRYKDLFDALDFAITSAFNGGRKIRETEPGLM